MKAQSAVEYLMTYGWMLLVVAVAGAAFFYVAGDQSVESISGFNSDVRVDNFGVSEGNLRFSILGGGSEELVISEINVTDKESGKYVRKKFTANNTVSVGEKQVFQLPNVSRSSSNNKLEVDVIYDSGGLKKLRDSGAISGSLEVDAVTETQGEGGIQPLGTDTLKASFSISRLQDWNQGTFEGASADKPDNSGNLGLGYLNGSNPSDTSLEKGLVGYWRMDRNVSGSGGTIKDYSGHGFDGTAENNLNTGKQGILSTNSSEFKSNAGSQVRISDMDLITSNSDDTFTVSAWIKTQDTKDFDGIITFTDFTGLFLCADGGFSVQSQGDNAGTCPSMSGVDDREWHHIVGTYIEGDSYLGYKDGEKVFNVSTSDDSGSNSDDTIIGVRQGADDHFSGKMDEVRVYNRSLSSSTIKKLYLEGKPLGGNYTSQIIENSETQNWKELEVEASINSSTENLTANFQTLKNSLLYTAEQAYNSLIDWDRGDFNKTTADEAVIEYNYSSELEASTQSGFNQGDFNGTSADRKDNSGDLGLGYRNGSSGDNLVGYWRLDRNPSGSGGSVKDYSGQNNDGSTSGGVNTSEKGVLDTGAFNFTDDDDDYIDLGQNYQFTDSENFTVSFWINADKVDVNDRPLGFDTTSAWGFLYLGFETGNDELGFRANSNVYLGQNKGVAEVSDGWVHVAVTQNSSGGLKMYENGSKVDSESSATWNNPDDIFVLGDVGSGSSTRWAGSGDNFDGALDEVRIYNQTLSVNQIDDFYFKGRPFQGNYTAKEIDNSQETNWDSLEVNASIPSDTSVNATFKALDTNGNLFGSQDVDLNDSLHNYSLSVSKSEDAEVFINGTSSNVTKSWEIHSLEVFSSEVKDKNEGLRIGYSNGSAGDDLVGYWRMDKNVSGDGGTVIDYSGHNLDGSTVGGVSNTSGILYAGAKDFSGSDDIVTFGDLEVGSWGEISASAWFKTGSISSNSRILAKDQTGTPGAFIIRHDGSNLEWYVRDGGSNSWILAETSVSVEDSEWHHVATTVDQANSETVLFLDGQRIASSSFSASTLDDSDNEELVIGGGSDISAPEQEWSGSIDEVRLYNSSINSQEVKELYFNGRPFQGNYTAEKIDNNQETSWEKVEINASVPSEASPPETNLTAEFEALDSSDNVVDRGYISVDSGSNNKNYSLSVQASEGARLSFNGTSSNVTKTWKVYDYKVYSGERQVDESEQFSVQDGLNNYSLGVSDSKDARLRLNGTSSNITQSWSISNMSVFTK